MSEQTEIITMQAMQAEREQEEQEALVQNAIDPLAVHDECPFEMFTMPSGAVVWYHDERHAYYRDVKRKSKQPDAEWVGVGRLTGVSTVVGPADFRPENLLRWAARTNGIGVAILAADALTLENAEDIRLNLAWLNSADAIWRELQANNLTFEDVRDQAGERGTNVHKQALHELAQGRPVPAYDEMTPEERGYAAGVSGFWLAHNPGPLQSEQVVVDLELGVAGRFDLRATLGAHCGRPKCPCAALRIGDVFLGDLKSSWFLSNKAHAQVAGYGHCAVRDGFGSAQAEWIIQVAGDGEWNVVQGHATVGDFLTFVEAYRRSGRISKAANADRKAREAA